MSNAAHSIKPPHEPSPRTVAGLRRCRLFERLYLVWVELQLTADRRATQQHLADVLGFDEAAISRWRHGGQRHHPSWVVLQRMAALTQRAVVFTAESWHVMKASALRRASVKLVCEPGAFDAVLLFCVAAQKHADAQPGAMRGTLADEIGVRRQHYSSWRTLGKGAEGMSPPPWASVLKAAALGGHAVVMTPKGWGFMPVSALRSLGLGEHTAS